jgi:hypothetical protein
MQMRRSLTVVLVALGLAASLVLAVGCASAGRPIDISKLGSANQIMVYKDGRPILDKSIATDSDEDKAVGAWLRSHADGWRTDFATYAPARRVRGENFTLDFHKDRCILNYRINEKGDWAQVSRPLSENELIPDLFTASR